MPNKERFTLFGFCFPGAKILQSPVVVFYLHNPLGTLQAIGILQINQTRCVEPEASVWSLVALCSNVPSELERVVTIFKLWFQNIVFLSTLPLTHET